MKTRETLYVTEQQRREIRTLMIGGLFYLIAGLHIVASQFYYSWGKHRYTMPMVVEILNYIFMTYFAMATIFILDSIIFAVPEA